MQHLALALRDVDHEQHRREHLGRQDVVAQVRGDLDVTLVQQLRPDAFALLGLQKLQPMLNAGRPEIWSLSRASIKSAAVSSAS